MKQQISFSQYVKEEIAEVYSLMSNKDKPLLAAYLRINASLILKEKKTNMVLSTENAKIAKLIYSKTKEYYGDDVHLSFVQTFKKKMMFKIIVGAISEDIIKDLDISFLEGKISKDMVKNDEMISAYLAGAFLACGSINSPATSNYHFEMSFHSENYAKWMLHLFSRYSGAHIEPKLSKRRDKTIIYVKKSQQIADFLTLIGAFNSRMDFENIRIERDFNNSENRLFNIDAANMKKISQTGENQVKEIKYIDEHLGIKNIHNEKQRLLCELRLENDSASLNELAALMSERLTTPITKSNINHLFRSLHQIYLRLAQ